MVCVYQSWPLAYNCKPVFLAGPLHGVRLSHLMMLTLQQLLQEHEQCIGGTLSYVSTDC